MHIDCKNQRGPGNSASGVPGALLGAEGARGEARRSKDSDAQGGTPMRVLKGAEAVEHGSGTTRVAAGGFLTSRQGWLARRGRTEGRGRMQTKENPLRERETAFPEMVGKCLPWRDAGARWSRHHSARAVLVTLVEQR